MSKGLKPSERQKVREMNEKVDKISDEDLMENKSATPVHDEVVDKAIKDPDVDKETTEYLKKVKKMKQKAREEGKLTYKEVRDVAKEERESNYEKVKHDMESKGEIDSAEERKKKARRNDA